MSTTDTNIPAAPVAGAQKQSSLMAFGQGGISIQTMEQAFIFAKAVINSGLAPRDFKTAEAVLIAVQMGAEIGLPPMAALQNIAVINGKPAIYGDAMKGVIDASGLLESYADEVQPTYAKVTVRRKGQSAPVVRTFSVEDAKRAGLWGKAGPWTQYPNRMLLMRARSWALRDAFGDVLKGCIAAEEAQDMPKEPKNVTPPAASQTLAALDAPVVAEVVPPAENKAADEPFAGDEQTRLDLEAARERSGA